MIDVVCGVIDDGAGRFLACRRRAGRHLGGLWEFPGGKIDPGESPSAALTRELREELDIEVGVGDPLEPVVWQYETALIRLHPFRCTILAGRPRPIDHDLILWCDPDDFASLEWAPADLPVIAALLRPLP